jgi:phosphoketolase
MAEFGERHLSLGWACRLGYLLVHAFETGFDDPQLLVAGVTGNGETASGGLAVGGAAFR